MTTATLTAPGTGTPTTWALDHPNVYGETRAAAITRADRALSGLDTDAAACPGACTQFIGDARRLAESIREGNVESFSLDGEGNVSWTIEADNVERLIGDAEYEHDTFCERD